MHNTTSSNNVLTVNAGSSSIKLAVFLALESPQKILEVSVENIGQPIAILTTSNESKEVELTNHKEAAKLLLDWISEHNTEPIVAVAHRIVHGGQKYHETQIATEEVLADLQEMTAFDPEHLPVELELVDAIKHYLPHAQQVLCFDTAFHSNLPTRSHLLPIPRKLADNGLRRYGFHGLSYAYILEELRRIHDDEVTNKKVIIAHLGSGASLAAIDNGEPIDTSMSFTPASGIPMSSRSGDLDPGIMLYLSKTQGFDAEQFNKMVNFESGLLGISETTADMKTLLEIESEDSRAKDAVDIFCYSVKKYVGSYSAALGGLDTLVFTGGMGENAPKVRSRVCEGLSFLGIEIDEDRNHAREQLISVEGGRVKVYVIHTDEAVTIVRETIKLIHNQRG